MKAILSEKEGIHISLRTIKSRLNDWNLQRKHDDVELGVTTQEELKEIVRNETEWEGRDAGYRKVTRTLVVKHNLHVKRDTVMVL